VHLGAKSGARLGFVEVGEEGIVLAIVDATGVQAFGKDTGEGGFADAERAFDNNEARSWECAAECARVWRRKSRCRHRFV